MNREEIIRMAREANFYESEISGAQDSFLHFAHLVAAAERKRICKQIAQLHDALSMASNPLITPRGSLGEEV